MMKGTSCSDLGPRLQLKVSKLCLFANSD